MHTMGFLNLCRGRDSLTNLVAAVGHSLKTCVAALKHVDSMLQPKVEHRPVNTCRERGAVVFLHQAIFKHSNLYSQNRQTMCF